MACREGGIRKEKKLKEPAARKRKQKNTKKKNSPGDRTCDSDLRNAALLAHSSAGDSVAGRRRPASDPSMGEDGTS